MGRIVERYHPAMSLIQRREQGSGQPRVRGESGIASDGRSLRRDARPSYPLAAKPSSCRLGGREGVQSSEDESRKSLACVHEHKSAGFFHFKPQQPVNLTLTGHHKEFNLSWDMEYKEYQNVDLFNYLMYRVRVRPKDVMEEKDWKVYNVQEDRRYQELQCTQLSPGRVYLVDVQASVNPLLKKLEGETLWSEWSESTVCTCPPPDFHNGPYTKKCWYSGLHEKSCLFQYIPDPNNFFKPLYHTYQGDFKKWVGPVFTFSSFDVLEKSAPLQVLSEKQPTAAPLQKPLLHDQGGGGSSLGDWSLLRWINPDLSKRNFLGSSSLGLVHSGGHISMDTVTVSGQESVMSEKTAGNSVQISEAEDLELGRSSGSEEQGFNDWQLPANDAENIEELSLDSFSSDEHSDYGYPQISLDLDTIDSGFIESDCLSPVSTECEGRDGLDDALLDGTVGTHSNYVKQWVAFTPASGENSNSL
ncbi:Interleukin-21 receptor [Bagarius yarrelli]|uniref:Interleukin-21 receptor n=1 Tax=Bagarius yarrelli TaxID=175774 RepID=A0A556V8P0_BAGYA|nr:Interleukin-21 receptor [Bagarius yarrelli]